MKRELWRPRIGPTILYNPVVNNLAICWLSFNVKPVIQQSIETSNLLTTAVRP